MTTFSGFLRQNTPADVLLGPLLDPTDFATGETGESPSVKLSKNGQALAAKNDATTPVSDADGYYNCEFDSTDTNTVGTLVLTVAKTASALGIRQDFQVLEEAVYDDLYASGSGTYAELAQGAPAATPTKAEIHMRVYMAAVQKLHVTKTAKEFYDSSGTKIAKKVLTGDATFYDEAKAITGA